MKHFLRDYSYSKSIAKENFHPMSHCGCLPLRIKILCEGCNVHNIGATGDKQILDTKVIHEPTGEVFYTQRRFITPREVNTSQYEVKVPFTVVDIFEKRPCRDQFLILLKEPRRMGKKFSNFQDVKNCPTLMRNLSWIREKGFISLKKEEWVNVYLSKQNNTHTGNHTFASVEEAEKNRYLNDTDRYIASVLKH